MANFDPFGACACCNGSPCTAPVIDWTHVTDKIRLGGNLLLLENSELLCSLGGRIRIFYTLAAPPAGRGAPPAGACTGPAVKPVALRMGYDVAHAVKIPVVGLGGISSAEDAIEFLMCGATAIEIGTANFVDPAITKKVKDGMNTWLDAHGCTSVRDIIGVI